MTIAVACNLADGLVMGADSAITIQGTIGQQSGVLKIYNDAEKLFPLYDLPVGIVTYGLALLQKRTIRSYIREFEHNHDKEEVKKWSIEKIAKKLWEFFNDKYCQAFESSLEEIHKKPFDEISSINKPGLGFMVGGFSPGEYLSELWDIKIHKNKDVSVSQTRPPGEFGSNWQGEIEGVRRFHKGFAVQHLDAVISVILEHYNVQMQDDLLKKIQAIANDAEYKIPWDGMSLQVGVDYVKFCLDIMINQTKFVAGASTCGGNVRIAVIQGDEQENFQYITDTNFVVRTL